MKASEIVYGLGYFVVGLAGGYEVFGTPEHYDKFMDKYLTWLEMRK